MAMRLHDEGRLGGWVALVSVLAALAYGDRLAGGEPPDDVLYTWSAAVAGAVVYAVILGVVLALCAGRSRRALLALRRPASWPRALGLGLAVIVGAFVLLAALEPLLHAGEEQGLTPSEWRPSRAPAFAANFVVVVLVAPVVEELTFRGLGYSLLERFGRYTAIAAIGIAFGLTHGLIAALPILSIFGAGLAYLRARTRSVYPGILVHSIFNALALTLAVST